jgi:hypothetical protein
MFLNYRSTLDKHNKIGFTNFGQVLLKICFLEALTNFLEIIFEKKRNLNTGCTRCSATVGVGSWGPLVS